MKNCAIVFGINFVRSLFIGGLVPSFFLVFHWLILYTIFCFGRVQLRINIFKDEELLLLGFVILRVNNAQFH